MAAAKEFLRSAWAPYSRLPLPTLLRVFIGRVFHGGGDSGASEMDVALGVILILLAMPGIMVSLLLFEKYGSLIRWMRGDGVFDPFTATIPDEYFFIVLSMVVTGPEGRQGPSSSSSFRCQSRFVECFWRTSAPLFFSR